MRGPLGTVHGAEVLGEGTLSRAASKANSKAAPLPPGFNIGYPCAGYAYVKPWAVWEHSKTLEAFAAPPASPIGLGPMATLFPQTQS